MKSNIDWSFIDYVPQSDQEFLEVCLPSKLWRMNNIYTVKNKQGKMVKFRMNPLQRKIAECVHNRKIVLKSRQVGISTYHLLYNLDDCIFEDNRTNGVMAQGLTEASELLEKCRHAWENLDPRIKDFLGVSLETDNTTEYGLSNNSKLMVRTSFRSGTLQNLHVSELGKIAARDPKKAKELKTGTFQAIGDDRKVTVESTAEGRSGYFYELWSQAEKMLAEGKEFSELDFYPIFISWVEDPDCTLKTPQFIDELMGKYFKEIEGLLGIKLTDQQKFFYVAKKRELGDDITQEYPSTPEEAFSAARDGSYYGNQMKLIRAKRRILPNLYDPNLLVNVSMDLGMNDDFTLVFWQTLNAEVRIIDCYANNGEGIRHYANLLYSKPYKYGEVYGPHDLVVTELTSGKSRKDVFRELGINIRVIKRQLINDGIEAVRIMLANTWIDASCTELIESMDNYTKEWDDRRGVWKNSPLHNEYSHMADAVRYMALSDSVPYTAVEQDKAQNGQPEEEDIEESDGFDI